MKVWFTSDTHFDDKRMIRTRRRPYSSVRKMNEDIVRRHNSKVQPNDIVFHLGDMFVGTQKSGLNWVKKLNGKIYLICGNHDEYKPKLYKRVHLLDGPKELILNDQSIIISHEPLINIDKNVWHLFGHAHGLFPEFGKRLDVGLDCHNFYPINFDEVKKLIKQSTLRKILKKRKLYKKFFLN